MALGIDVIKIIPTFITGSSVKKIANKSPMHGKIIICDVSPISKTFKFFKTSTKFFILVLMPIPSMI